MSEHRKPLESAETSCRIGLVSRLDFPNRGYRVALWQQAAKDFAAAMVHYVVVAGGLIDGRYIKEQTKKLSSHIKQLRNQIKSLEKQLKPPRGKEAPSLSSELVMRVNGDIGMLQAEIDRYEGFLKELTPESLAQKLARLLPHFTGANGEPVNVHVVPSPAFDGEIGEEIAHILGDIRDDVIVGPSGSDRFEISQAHKVLEVVVPEKGMWMRSDYFSTPVQRMLNDKLKQTARELPDLYFLGCFGASIAKPRGEFKRPVVTVGALHRIQSVRVNENQIGVRVVTVHRDREEADVVSYPYKDLINAEYKHFPLPQGISPTERIILETIQMAGGLTAGRLVERLNRTDLEQKIGRADVEQALNRLMSLPADNWPGLRFDRRTKRYNFSDYWLRDHVRYDSRRLRGRTDSIVAFSCTHAGSRFADLVHFREAVPKAILDRNANILVGAGDFVEGTKYGSEVIAGMNETAQERLIGSCIADVMVEVFNVRLGAVLTKIDASKLTPRRAIRLVDRSLVMFLMVEGNHDAWVEFGKIEPLSEMRHEIRNRLLTSLAETLKKRRLQIDTATLLRIIDAKVVKPEFGEYVLPSGIKLTMMHPYMSRTKTVSIRPQEMLDKAADSHLVIGGNFHVACEVEAWEAKLGQRTCLQLGTMKRRSDFEDHKLKTVDHGFGWVKITSAGGRVIAVESTFFSRPEDERSTIDPSDVTASLLKHYGIQR